MQSRIEESRKRHTGAVAACLASRTGKEFLDEEPKRRLRHLSAYQEGLCARCARTDAHFLVNRGTHHGQYLIGNVSHVMDGRDVIGDIGQDLLLGVAACFERASRNKVITVKNFCHKGSPKYTSYGPRAGATMNASKPWKRVNSTRSILRLETRCCGNWQADESSRSDGLICVATRVIFC